MATVDQLKLEQAKLDARQAKLDKQKSDLEKKLLKAELTELRKQIKDLKATKVTDQKLIKVLQAGYDGQFGAWVIRDKNDGKPIEVHHEIVSGIAKTLGITLKKKVVTKEPDLPL